MPWDPRLSACLPQRCYIGWHCTASILYAHANYIEFIAPAVLSTQMALHKLCRRRATAAPCCASTYFTSHAEASNRTHRSCEARQSLPAAGRRRSNAVPLALRGGCNLFQLSFETLEGRWRGGLRSNFVSRRLRDGGGTVCVPTFLRRLRDGGGAMAGRTK